MLTRIKVFTAIFLAAFALLVARLFYWQIYKGQELSVEARQQYTSGQSIDAKRGDILSSDGTWLAASGESWLVFTAPKDITGDPEKIANDLAPFFVEDPDDRESLLIEIDRIKELVTRDAYWVPLKQNVPPEVKKNIEALGIEGIGFEFSETRVYPESSSAAQLLGFVGKDDQGNNKGYSGLEGYYDLTLSGRTGFVSRESDALGNPILLDSSKEVLPIGGVDLLTHIDKTVQLSIEEKLKDAIETYGAKSGMVIVMDPDSGAVMGMASYPSYDPKNYFDYNGELFKNPAVSSTYEPGSVFKILVMASALDAGVVEPDTKCDICSGPLKVDKYYIRTWNNEYYPDATMTDVIVNSDNVGMTFVGKRLGSDKLYDYLHSFGIGQPTGVDLQGEASPRLREKDDWSVVDLATASFGQGVAVTPIQMIRATAAIANDGVKMTPQVVDEVVTTEGDQDISPQDGGRVISEKAANQITAMMVEAAKNGEAKWTHRSGFGVAGKTGTAQIPIEGHYDEEKTIASFVGFAPYDDPKFVMLTTLSEPESSPWASETAAPLWYSIASDFFPYFGIHPEN